MLGLMAGSVSVNLASDLALASRTYLRSQSFSGIFVEEIDPGLLSHCRPASEDAEYREAPKTRHVFYLQLFSCWHVTASSLDLTSH